MGASGETETAGGRSKKKTVSHIHRHLVSSGWGVGWSGQVRVFNVHIQSKLL